MVVDGSPGVQQRAVLVGAGIPVHRTVRVTLRGHRGRLRTPPGRRPALDAAGLTAIAREPEPVRARVRRLDGLRLAAVQDAAHGPGTIGHGARTAHRAGGFVRFLPGEIVAGLEVRELARDVVGHVRDVDDIARLAVELAVERFRELLELASPNGRVTDEGEHVRRREAGRCGRHPIERVAVAEDVGLAGVLMLAGPAREGG